jgi:hypothetical protein
MADASMPQPDPTSTWQPPTAAVSPRPSGPEAATTGPAGATTVPPSAAVGGVPPEPEAKLRRLARSVLLGLVLGWLAAAVAVLAAVPTGFVVTRWWAYGFALLALNSMLAVLVLVTGDSLRHLTLGADHRASTSKAQVAAWTYLVVFALGALLLMGRSLNCPPAGAPQAHCVQLRAPLADAFDAFRTKGLQPAYLLLLGLPTVAAVAAKAITTTKIATARSQGHPAAKTPAPDTNLGLGDRVAELVSDDGGDTDLGDLQYQLFSLLTMAWFLVTFLPHPLNPEGLPDLPATLIGLTGVSTAGYVTKKALEPAAAGDPGGRPSRTGRPRPGERSHL